MPCRNRRLRYAAAVGSSGISGKFLSRGTIFPCGMCRQASDGSRSFGPATAAIAAAAAAALRVKTGDEEGKKGAVIITPTGPASHGFRLLRYSPTTSEPLPPNLYPVVLAMRVIWRARRKLLFSSN